MSGPHQSLGTATGAAAPPPPSPLTEYIAALPSSYAGRLALATALSADPTPLVDAFDATATNYASYANLHPFTPGRTERYLPGCGKGEEVAAALEGAREPWRIAGASELDFVYVDREIVPAAGHTRRDVVKIDVVLATASGRVPIIGEIKTETDTDAFVGLLQAMEAAAQLCGAVQRARLRLWGSRADFVLADSNPYLFVLLVNHTTNDARAKVLRAAKRVRNELRHRSEVRAVVRRTEFLHVTCREMGRIELIRRA